ncbi:MAG: DNA recombination protein RmuC [Endomicrobia bacterium]|nr:DNA recombination protein RmuC [Endomicrobiia bacterium]MCX7941274.1 DNA recombination protein RmuC [Endomicrobiia bacterium]MDW8055085.1 DNA recombination protein RmuC [Elusimicrobiota bacterium]
MQFIFLVIVGLLIIIVVYLLVTIKTITEQKLADFNTKLELSTQTISEFKNSIFSSLSLLQNNINQAINQVTSTDSTFRTQLELLRSSINEQISSTIRNLSLQMKTATETTTEGFKLVSQQVDERLKNTTEIFSQIIQMVTKLNSSAEQLMTNTQELQRSLSSVHLRGSFGEVLLERLLQDIFPREMLRFQFPVNPHSNEKADAVIIFRDKVIPIDSKFNLEKFEDIEKSTDETSRQKAERELLRTIKEQIDTISKKYVLPQYGAEYAFMYIPSESGFLKVFNLKMKDDENVIKYAAKNRVIICSPQTLLPYLQFIIMGIETEQIAKNISVLRQQIESLITAIVKFGEKYSVLGKHLKNAYEKFVEVETDLRMLELQVKNVASLPASTIQKLPE